MARKMPEGWHVGLLKMNAVAAVVAVVSDLTTQVAIEGKMLTFRKAKKQPPLEDGPTAEGALQPAAAAAATTEEKSPVDWLRTARFAGLNLTILVPTTMWVGFMEVAFPSQPLLQSVITWTLWNPFMFTVALTYRGLFARDEGQSRWESIKDTFRTEFKYLPVTYAYALPIVLMNFYVLPLEYVPVFMVVVDFFSDMLGSWWIHRRKEPLDEVDADSKCKLEENEEAEKEKENEEEHVTNNNGSNAISPESTPIQQAVSPSPALLEHS